MPRPCAEWHQLLPLECRHCYWCVVPSDKGRKFRAQWGEPEPEASELQLRAILKWEPTLLERPVMPPTPRVTGRARLQQRVAEQNRCSYRGQPTGRLVGCDECGARNSSLPVLHCLVHGECTERVSVNRSLASCRRCDQRVWVDPATLVTVPVPPPLELSEPTSDRAVVTCAAGPEGESLYEISRPWIEGYARRVRADLIVLRWRNPVLGIYSKQAMYEVLDKYPRVVFLDADTLGNPLLVPDLFELVPPGQLACYNELEELKAFGTLPAVESEMRRARASQGLPPLELKWYGNSGVILFEVKHKPLFTVPAKPYPRVHCGEQHHWVSNIIEAGITPYFLPPSLNRQWWANKDLNAAGPADIVHFSGLRPQYDNSVRLTMMRKYRDLKLPHLAVATVSLGEGGGPDPSPDPSSNTVLRGPSLDGDMPEPEPNPDLPPATPVPLPMPYHVRKKPRPLRWAYGVTTVPERAGELLPRTLESLAAAGFTRPRLFVDGCTDPGLYQREPYPRLAGEVVARPSRLRTFGNWMLALWETYLREPNAERYAIFQDDFVTYPNLRYYLDGSPYPAQGYCNLYTFPSNQSLAPKTPDGKEQLGWYPSNQFGRGAVALIFDLEATMALLSSRYMVERPRDAHRGWKAVDGGIVTAAKQLGIKEFVHNPSLVQHTGEVSSMGNRPHLKATSFRGETYDALELLPCLATR